MQVTIKDAYFTFSFNWYGNFKFIKRENCTKMWLTPIDNYDKEVLNVLFEKFPKVFTLVDGWDDKAHPAVEVSDEVNLIIGKPL